MERQYWSEKLLERRLQVEIKKLGGVAIKFSSAVSTAYPDRLIQLPGGITAWAEMKSTGEKPTPLQWVRIRELRALGFLVEVIDTMPGLLAFIEQLKNKMGNA